MERQRGRWTTLLSRLLPASAYGDDPERVRRARFTLVFATSLTFATLAFASFQVFFGSPWIAMVAGSGPVSTVTALVVLLVWRKEGLAANLLCLALTVVLTIVVVLRGGMGQPVGMAYAAVPMLALVLADRRAGLVWLGVTVATLVGIVAVEWVFPPLPTVALASPNELNLLGHILYTMLMFFIVVVFDNLWRRSLTDLERAQAGLLEAEKRRLESETEARLLRSSRMAELGTLAAGVAHEINSPLTYVKANVAHLLDGGEASSPDDIRAALEETLEGARRIEKIVRDIGLFSRIEDEDETAAVDVHEVLESSVRLLWNQIRHRATLERSWGEVGPAEANASRLGQVFVNLLMNAVQAIPEGKTGRIVLRTLEAADGSVVIELADDGAGMTKELQARALEPFFTTKPVGEGTGLGLSICYGIVESLGGSLELESAPGEGTTVTVTLPRARPGASGAPPSPTPTKTGKRLRILLVDDDPLVGRAMARQLSGHAVTPVATAREALELLEADDAFFDAILCDLMMPEMTGMELYHAVTERAPGASKRFIFMTGGAFTPGARAFLDGFEGPCLDKPVALVELKVALEAVEP